MSLRFNIYKNWSKNRDNVVLSLLEFNRSDTVVDFGCGDGKFTLKIKKVTGCSELIGVDIHEESLKIAKEKGIIVKKADLNKKLPFENDSCDAII